MMGIFHQPGPGFGPKALTDSVRNTIHFRVMKLVKVRLPERRTHYEIKVAPGWIPKLGEHARAALGDTAHRVAVFSNQRVFELFGADTVRSLRRAGFETGCWLMKDGERHKSIQSFEKALAFLGESGLERSDAVVALGGGVVGDLAGFAAATYL